MGAAYVVTSYRVSVAGGPLTPYVELSRKRYRWRRLAKLLRGPVFYAGKVRDGEWAFVRTEVVDEADIANWRPGFP